MKNATNRNSAPTIQRRKMKHAPDARNTNVAATDVSFGQHCNQAQHCTRHCIEVIL